MPRAEVTGLSCKSMGLKGVEAVDAVAKTMQVLYDEGGPSPVPYVGLVVYVEPARVYVVFDGFDEAEGAWVDDSDDWTWSNDPEVKVPVPAAAAPAWSENQPAGLVDKIYLHRSNEEGQHISYFVKWKEAAHLHSQWVPSAALEAEPVQEAVQGAVKRGEARKKPARGSARVPSCSSCGSVSRLRDLDPEVAKRARATARGTGRSLGFMREPPRR